MSFDKMIRVTLLHVALQWLRCISRCSAKLRCSRGTRIVNRSPVTPFNPRPHKKRHANNGTAIAWKVTLAIAWLILSRGHSSSPFCWHEISPRVVHEQHSFESDRNQMENHFNRHLDITLNWLSSIYFPQIIMIDYYYYSNCLASFARNFYIAFFFLFLCVSHFNKVQISRVTTDENYNRSTLISRSRLYCQRA